VVFGVAFSTIAWSLGDTYSHLATPALSPWGAAVAHAFTNGREYRPLFDLGIKGAYEVAGTWLPFYQALVLLSFGTLLMLIAWVCRPIGWRRGLAACIAISCVSALHTSRILFGFWPLNHYAAVMVAVLFTIALALHPGTRRIDWVFGPLALIATLVLELGALIVPVTLVLWWFGAPGLSRRGAVSVAAGAASYLAIRFALADYSGESLYGDTGFGFYTLDAASIRARFGEPPWMLWIYNVAGTFLTIVASEPREGVYSFVESLLARDMENWRWFHVGLSGLTTAVVAGGLVWGWPWKERDRLLVVAGCSLLVFGSGLGFLYTRDRIGLAGGIGYALLLFVACAAWLEKAPVAEGRRRVVTGVVTIVALAWVVRGGEMFFQLRDTAWDYRLEWTERLNELSAAREQTELMEQLRKAALSRTPADPRRDPAWTYFLFERRFRRSVEAP
jgi:hypothetical protein